MTGMELILSTVCNITLCEPNQTMPTMLPMPPAVQSDMSFIKVKRDLDIKAAAEMINGKHLRVGTYNDGFRSWVEIQEDGKVVGKGIAFDVMNYLSEKLNFTYEVVLPQNYSKIADKKILESLLVKMIIKNKIDIAAAFILFTTERKDLVTFELELDTINCLTKSLIKLPQDVAHYKRSLRQSNLDILQPFNADVWCVFLLTLTLYVTCFVLLTKLRSKLIVDDEESFTMSSCLSYAYRVMIHQSSKQSTKVSMTRILLMTWSFFAVLVTTYYAAHLSQSYTVIAVAQKDNIERELTRIEDADVDVDYGDLFQCHTKTAIDYYMKRPSGFVYPRNTNFNILFGVKIRRLYHIGLLYYIYDRYKNVALKICPDVLRIDGQSLSVDDLMALYYTWVIGVVVAIAVFLVELILNIFTKPNKPLPAEATVEELDTEVVHHDLDPPTCRTETSHQPTTSLSPFQRRIVNGRRYLVAKTRDGDVRLVPVDTLSALPYNLDLYENI